MPGTVDFSGVALGRYRLLALLGAGGMGAVYEAIDAALGRKVAVKILPPHLVSDAGRVRRFVQEARTASGLNHPHLVSIYDIGQEQVNGQELQFIAMEKIDGATLRETLAAAPLPLKRGLELLVQVTEAVGAAHDAGVVHRDLKPENIMVARAGYAKVLDFGLAKLHDDAASPSGATEELSTESGVVLGTAGYMAPEQAQGRPADQRADVFSLGCIAYEIATGRRAFRGTSPIDTLHKIIHSEPEPMGADVPQELQRIVRKALAKDPNERYQSARELAIDLRELLREQSAPALRRVTVIQPRRLRTIAAALAFVLLVAAPAVMLWRRSAARETPQPLRIDRITSTGNVIAASISPDGRYVAYVESEGGTQSLWLRQLASDQILQLVPAGVAHYFGHTFTPDGTAVMFVATDPNVGTSLFRVSTLGGPTERIVDDVGSIPAFSPDGRRLAFARADFPRAGESAIVIVDANGANPRVVATRRYPEAFAPIFFGGVSWSPDGTLIAAPTTRGDQGPSARLVGVRADGGGEIVLSDFDWRTLGNVAWLPDGDALVVAGARDEDVTKSHLWLVPRNGEPRRITNDLLNHRMVSLSADGKSLVAIGGEASTQIWTMTMDERVPRRISGERFDAWLGITLLPDGRIVAGNDDRGNALFVMNADGSGRARLTRDTHRNGFPAAFASGIAYVSATKAASEICVIGFDGSGRRAVITGVDWQPIDVSPDGQWIAFTRNRRLWRVRRDGTGAQQLTTAIAQNPAFSPDGARIAFHYLDRGVPRLGIMPAGGGALSWSMPSAMRYGSCARWLPDGSGLVVNDNPGDLWKIPFRGRPEKLMAREDQITAFFDLSSDGSMLALARGRMTRDAVLLAGFR